MTGETKRISYAERGADMTTLSIREAQLFRLLTAFFGSERVIPHMSIFAICGGDFPSLVRNPEKFRNWAKRNRCLFTIINFSDDPKLVVDFGAHQDGVIDVDQLERERLLPDLFSDIGIRYITISAGEFSEMTRGEAPLSLCSLLEKKIGISVASS